MKLKIIHTLVITIILLIVSKTNGLAQTIPPAWRGVTTFGGTYGDYAGPIALDKFGNRYLTGTFQHTVAFGNTTLTSFGLDDVFVLKLNPAGVVQWAINVGGPNDDSGLSIVVDTAGFVYVTGSYAGNATFGTTTLFNLGSTDMFLMKLNPAGSIQWVKRAGGTGADGGRSVAVDKAGNSFVAGSFQNIVNFGGPTLTSNGSWDIYIAKYDAAGNIVWAKGFGGTSSDFPSGIGLDAAGFIYISANIQATVTFGSTTLTSAGLIDAAIVKFDQLGNALWARKGGGTGWDYANDIAVDSAGNCWLTGDFRNPVTFGTTTLVNIGSGYQDIFIARYTTNGVLKWVRRGGGTAYENVRAMAVDNSGNTYLSGEYNGTAIFGTYNLACNGPGDLFVVKYDSLGNVGWALRAGGSSYDHGWGIAIDTGGYFVVAGAFDTKGRFGNFTPQSNGYYDIFVATLGPPVDLGITAVTSPSSGCSLSNAADVTVTIKNFSATPQSGFNVAYRLNNGPLVSENVGSLIIPAQATMSYTFAAKANLASPGSYTVKAFTQLPGDTDFTNDTTSKTIESFAPPVKPTITIAGGGTGVICQGASLTLNGAPLTFGLTYSWSLNGAVIAGAFNTSYTTTTPGNYRLITTTAAGCKDSSAVTTVSIIPKPITPTITQAGSSLTASTTSGTYQWYSVNGTSLTLVPGATGATFTPTASGSYTVVVTANGCESDPAAATNVVLGISTLAPGMSLEVFPNPTNGKFLVELAGFEKEATFQVMNVTGQIVVTKKVAITSKNKTSQPFSLNGLAKGVYILKVTSGANLTFRKVILD